MGIESRFCEMGRANEDSMTNMTMMLELRADPHSSTESTEASTPFQPIPQETLPVFKLLPITGMAHGNLRSEGSTFSEPRSHRPDQASRRVKIEILACIIGPSMAFSVVMCRNILFSTYLCLAATRACACACKNGKNKMQ